MAAKALLMVFALGGLSTVGCEDTSTSGPDPDAGTPSGGGLYGLLDALGNGDPTPTDAGYLPSETPGEPGTGTGATCGAHAAPSGDECFCDRGYEPCSRAPLSADCCRTPPPDDPPAKPSGNPGPIYGLDVMGMRIRPFKYEDADGQPVPWDWDGSIPGWLFDALHILATFYPEAETWAEVLEKVNEYAPILLEGTTPPDPYIKFTDSTGNNPGLYSMSSYLSDTTEPNWSDALIDVSTFESAGFVVVEVWDKDIAIDDFMGQFMVPVDQLASFSIEGDWWALESTPTLYEAKLASY